MSANAAACWHRNALEELSRGSDCSLTWQTPPFKGKDGGAAMICVHGAEMEGNEIYLRGRRRAALGILSGKASICHNYHIRVCFQLCVWVNIGVSPACASVISLTPKSVRPL